MTPDLHDFMRWEGVWGGSGEAQTGLPIAMRLEFEPIQDRRALRMHFEACDPGFESLYHGVRAVLAPAPGGALKAVAYSTVHKSFLLEQMPDDIGVLALSGGTDGGHRVTVAFVEEGTDAMHFTGYWRNDGEVDTPDAPRMSVRLRRLRPLQFSRPPG